MVKLELFMTGFIKFYMVSFTEMGVMPEIGRAVEEMDWR